MNYLYAVFCVFLFSLTVPITRLATFSIDPSAVATLRLLGAGLICLYVIVFVDRWVPPRPLWRPLIFTAIGCVWGFSFLIAWAMSLVPGSHGAVGLAALPMMTAGYASLRDRTNPGARFWVFCLLGTLVASAFFAMKARSELMVGDWVLGAAFAVGALGYVEGARMSRRYGGRRIMCWGVVLSVPVAVVMGWKSLMGVPPVSQTGYAPWVALAYLAVFSQTLGMFLWFKVLAKGPLAKVALIQLIQPFLALAAAWLILKEHVEVSAWITASAVILCVLGANRSRKAAPVMKAREMPPADPTLKLCS